MVFTQVGGVRFEAARASPTQHRRVSAVLKLGLFFVKFLHGTGLSSSVVEIPAMPNRRQSPEFKETFNSYNTLYEQDR